jgi:hypothetical protein
MLRSSFNIKLCTHGKGGFEIPAFEASPVLPRTVLPLDIRRSLQHRSIRQREKLRKRRPIPPYLVWQIWRPPSIVYGPEIKGIRWVLFRRKHSCVRQHIQCCTLRCRGLRY